MCFTHVLLVLCSPFTCVCSCVTCVLLRAYLRSAHVLLVFCSCFACVCSGFTCVLLGCCLCFTNGLLALCCCLFFTCVSPMFWLWVSYFLLAVYSCVTSALLRVYLSFARSSLAPYYGLVWVLLMFYLCLLVCCQCVTCVLLMLYL